MILWTVPVCMAVESMFSLFWRCLFLAFIHRVVVSTPIDVSGGLSSIQEEGFFPLNTSLHAPVSFSSLTAPDPNLPHRFRVPGEEMVLRLGFGLFRTSVDPVRLQSLVRFALGIIEEGAAEHGWDQIYPTYMMGRQQFLYSLGEGISLRITNFRNLDLFTWRHIHTLVKALNLFLIEGNRPYLTKFKFFVGPGPTPDVTESAKGCGAIFKEKIRQSE